MVQTRFDALSRGAAAMSRRSSLFTLGGAGLAAALGGAAPTAAKKKKNKNKKKCNQEKSQCQEDVKEFCAQFDTSAPQCEAALLPCCATCNVATGVICVANFLTGPA